jgi:hypothetical protein
MNTAIKVIMEPITEVNYGFSSKYNISTKKAYTTNKVFRMLALPDLAN